MSQYETSSTSSSKFESLEEHETDAKAKRNRWVTELQYAEKEREKFVERGRKVVKRYLDERDDISNLDRKFNIFYANTEIIKAALYSDLPKIEVSRRFCDPDDDVARVAAVILQRNLEQDLDEQHCDFDDTLRACVEDVLLPGLGVAWLRMEVETETQSIEATVDPISGVELAPATEYEVVVEQEIYTDWVFWEDFLWSPCKIWKQCRWIARKVYMTRDELKKKFGDELGGKIPLDHNPGYRTGFNQNTPKNEAFKQACVYEIWDKDSKKVVWVSKSHPELLDEQEDPLEIESFWPMPVPMMANTTTSNAMPKADYVMFQDQYNELDTVNTRIQMLIQACKVVGVYDRGAGSVQRMLQEGVDNTLIPVDNWAMFAEKGGMKGVIDWLPLEQVVKALERLEKNREDIKQQIYELTGIADIVRGATKASETLGAQELKAKFAGIKIQSRKDMVTKFAEDIFRIKAEILVKHFDEEMLLKRSNIMMTSDAQYAAQAVQLLKDHASFEWRIKIEPDSMSRADYAQERQDLIDLFGVLTGMMDKLPMILQQAPLMAPFFMELMKQTVAKYRFGKNVESAMDMMLKNTMQQLAQPQPPKPDPVMIKTQAEVKAIAEKTQAGIAATKMKTQAEIQRGQAELMAKLKLEENDAENKNKASEIDNLLKIFKANQDAKRKDKESDGGSE